MLNQDKLLFVKGLPNAENKHEIAWILPVRNVMSSFLQQMLNFGVELKTDWTGSRGDKVSPLSWGQGVIALIFF